MDAFKKTVPGLLLTAAIGTVAYYLAPHVPYAEAVTVALILGIIVGNLVPLPAVLQPGVRYSEKKILAWAIALLGLKLEFRDVAEMGPQVALVVLPTMALVMAAAILFGRLLKEPRRFSILIGTGNAVCGSSAIAAVAPGVDAHESEIGISIGVVNFLGTIGMLALPPLCLALHFSDRASAYLLGGGLQAVGQVAAAGGQISDNVMAMATLVKMLRVLMLVVLVVVAPLLAGRKGGGATKKSKLVPGYLIGFVVFSIFASLFSESLPGLIAGFKNVGHILLMVAMAAIGLRIRFVELIHQAPRALITGILVWLVQLGFLLGLIFALGV